MADWHLGKYWKSNNSTFNRAKKILHYLTLNLYNIISSFPYERLHLIVAGDLFDSVHCNTEMIVYIRNNLTSYLRNFKWVNVVAGNHEIFIDKDGRQQSLITFGLMDNVYKLIDHIEAFGFCSTKTNYIMIPYLHDLENTIDEQLHKCLRKEYRNIIIGHFTPKEIFSYEKYSIDALIDKYGADYNIPYIILGHYHKPVIYHHNNTIVISVGNSYYQNISDIKEYLNDSIHRRYLIIDDSAQKIYSRDYILPEIVPYYIDSQKEFESEVIPEVLEKYNPIEYTAPIIYINSKNLIDYSQLTFKGYDIYFDLIEDTNNNIITLSEIIDNNSTSYQSLLDRWDRYINLIPTETINSNERELANWLFNKRNDSDITTDGILSILSKGVDDYANY